MSFQERARDAIRANGGRITPQRDLLLDVLAENTHDIDADRLHQLASAHDPNLSLPTVYRILNTLESAGVITSRYLSSQHDRKVYRIPAADDAGTFHFTCSGCGRLIPFQSDVVEQLKANLSDRLAVDVQTLCMCAGGLCADCQKGDNQMTLNHLTSGQSATVKRISGQGALRRRLMDMGLVRGTRVEMLKAAPMGDPVEYLVRGYHLSLRKSEAELIEITDIHDVAVTTQESHS
jgi:ferrous iron transport protein A